MDLQIKNFPIEIQIEIFKYKPFFRRINKEFYYHGRNVFNQLYSHLPISKYEFMRYQTHFHGTIFKHMDYDLAAIYLRNDDKNELRLELNHNPRSISSRHYCKHICVSIMDSSGQYDNYNRMVKNFPYVRVPLLYDLQSTIQIIKNRQCLIIDQQFIKYYLDSLFISNGSDFDNLNTKLQYIFYLAPPEDLLTLNIQINYRFYNEIVIEDENYCLLKQQIDQLYHYYYNLAMNI